MIGKMLNNIYIRIDDRKYVNKIDKLKTWFNRISGRITVEKIQNGIIVLLPQNYNENKIRLSIIKKGLNRIIKTKNTQNIIYAKGIEEIVNLKNVRSVFNGKILMKSLICDILDYIYKLKGKKQELEDVHIFVNEYNKENLYMIDKLIDKFKTVNIITSNISKFKKLEEIYERNNILITVSNNKRKSAKNARMIINVDFVKNGIGKYIINNTAIIINLNIEKNIIEGNFNGIIINDYNILLNKDTECFVNEFYGNVNLKLYIESHILNMDYEIIDKFLKEQRIGIQEIIGIRGKISKQEIQQNSKFN